MYIILELEANLIAKLANLTSFSGEINLQVDNYRQTSLFDVFLAGVPGALFATVIGRSGAVQFALFPA